MIFEELTQRQDDSSALVAAMSDAVNRLLGHPAESSDRDAPKPTSSEHPGMLLGKIQAGKTRAFIGNELLVVKELP